MGEEGGRGGERREKEGDVVGGDMRIVEGDGEKGCDGGREWEMWWEGNGRRLGGF